MVTHDPSEMLMNFICVRVSIAVSNHHLLCLQCIQCMYTIYNYIVYCNGHNGLMSHDGSMGHDGSMAQWVTMGHGSRKVTHGHSERYHHRKRIIS